jgi:hypothetical protein
MDKQLSTSSAILVGSAMIAAAVYFGLRHGLAARGAEDRSPLPAALRPPSTGGPAPAPRPTASRSEVARQVAGALDAHRAALAERCWRPSFQRDPAPPVVKYVFNFTFDADGRQVARGVAEDRETARPDVTSCITTALPPLVIPPPGASMYVEVPFALP